MAEEPILFAQIDSVATKYLSAGKPLPGDNYLFDDLIEQVGGKWAEISAAEAYQILRTWRRNRQPGSLSQH